MKAAGVPKGQVAFRSAPSGARFILVLHFRIVYRAKKYIALWTFL